MECIAYFHSYADRSGKDPDGIEYYEDVELYVYFERDKPNQKQLVPIDWLEKKRLTKYIISPELTNLDRSVYVY